MIQEATVSADSQAVKDVEQVPILKLQLEHKQIETPLQTLRAAVALKGCFQVQTKHGPVPESHVPWGQLIDTFGYAEVVAAKYLLKDLDIVEQADRIGSPGGISFKDTFDLHSMLADVEANLP